MGQVCIAAISSNRACPPRSSLLSVQCARSCSLGLLVPVFNGWGQGQGPFLPSPPYQVSCRLLGCGVETFGQAYALVLGRSACRAVPLLRWGGGVAGRPADMRDLFFVTGGKAAPTSVSPNGLALNEKPPNMHGGVSLRRGGGVQPPPV